MVTFPITFKNHQNIKLPNMSKRLPYYQSEPAEYLAGDIMICSYSAQGVFTILRAIYWQKDCELTLTQAKKRILNADDEFNELIKEGIIKIINDNISINFLNEQYNTYVTKSSVNSENGKKGAQKRWSKIAKNSESIAPPSIRHSESIALREDKIKEDNINTAKPQYSVSDTFDIFWNHYHETTQKKKESKEPAFKYWKKLTLEERRKAYNMVKLYSKTNTDVKYLVKARTYLSDKRFNDEFELNKPKELDKYGNEKFDFGTGIAKV